MNMSNIDTDTVRETGRRALAAVLTRASNIRLLEKVVYRRSSPATALTDASAVAGDAWVDGYKTRVYQIATDIQQGTALSTVLDRAKADRYVWRHPTFDTVRLRIAEQDEFIVNPFHVEEGVIDCKCGSKRVFSYSKQTRGADEPMTTFCECVECQNRWTYSG